MRAGRQAEDRLVAFVRELQLARARAFAKDLRAEQRVDCGLASRLRQVLEKRLACLAPADRSLRCGLGAVDVPARDGGDGLGNVERVNAPLQRPQRLDDRRPARSLLLHQDLPSHEAEPLGKRLSDSLPVEQKDGARRRHLIRADLDQHPRVHERFDQRSGVGHEVRALGPRERLLKRFLDLPPSEAGVVALDRGVVSAVLLVDGLDLVEQALGELRIARCLLDGPFGRRKRIALRRRAAHLVRAHAHRPLLVVDVIVEQPDAHKLGLKVKHVARVERSADHVGEIPAQGAFLDVGVFARQPRDVLRHGGQDFGMTREQARLDVLQDAFDLALGQARGGLVLGQLERWPKTDGIILHPRGLVGMHDDAKDPGSWARRHARIVAQSGWRWNARALRRQKRLTRRRCGSILAFTYTSAPLQMVCWGVCVLCATAWC